MRKPWATWSLGRRLVFIATFAMVMALVVGGFAMYWAAGIEDDQMLDARLEQLGSTVLSFVENGLTENGRPDIAKGVRLKTRPTAALLYRYQVWSSDGVLLLHSHEAPIDRPLMDLARFGFDRVRVAGENYRTFALPSRDRRMVVQVAECIEERIDQVAVVTGYYFGFLLLPFGLLSAATWLLLRRSLRSIESIALQLHDRNPLDVTPLRVDSPPQEMMPILKSLDDMFERVRQAISVERRFTSVAAHELRTPLAGLRAHAQLASTAEDPVAMREALAAVLEGVDRASHLLSQLLDLARIEALAKERGLRFETVAFRSVYADAVRDLRGLATGKGVLVTDDFEVSEINALPFGLFLVMRNLLANAILYCPTGGAVRVLTLRQGSSIVLRVDDSGPGIATEDRERAFERFNRLGQKQSQGVGLGLSIVLMVVELHAAKISLLDSPLGGLRTQIVFAAPHARVESSVHLDIATA
jgi:signal transduction histidine kinase